MLSTRVIVLVLSTALAGCAGGSAGPTSTSATGGECAVVGTWVGQVPAGLLMGRVLTMVFSEDHTAQGTCDRVTLNSTWQLAGNTVEVRDVSATPPFAQCDPTVVGRYTLEFDADCQTVFTVSGEDTCEHRRLALLGFRARRQ